MSSQSIQKYGAAWKRQNPKYDDVLIEMGCIKRGGKWTDPNGNECGLGLFQHYKNLQMLLWPDDYHHRWTDLQLQTILENVITMVSGPKDTGKTHVSLVRFGLTDYFCFPEETLIIVSSTTLSALEMRVWGDMKSMFAKATQRFPFLPGNMLESKRCIATDSITEEDDIRDLRRGIITVPCKNSAGQFTGIASYVGMKQKRRRHLGDEYQFMAPGMMESIANMNSGDYKGVFVGNPIGQGDPLDKMSEPECGWEAHPEPTKTTVWKNKRFLNSKTICLYGPDSPTFDFPDGPQRYPGLINQDSIDRVIAGYGKDSHQYYSQCLGVRKSGLNARRVLTRDLCQQFQAFEEAVWESSDIIKICAVDAAYGGTGGDRCVGGHIEFGPMQGGFIGIKFNQPILIPVSVRKAQSPEDQIATWVMHYCQSNGIPPENFFYDSTGRGSLGPALARIWSAMINPVEFGGVPTDRPVSQEFRVFDHSERTYRLKTCREHYSKFVTELWFSLRYAVESGQVRNMPDNVCDEACMREWREVAGARIEIETKKEMKLRTGESPDLVDWAVTCIEGARQRGFQIAKIGNSDDDETYSDWLNEFRVKKIQLNKRNQLIKVP